MKRETASEKLARMTKIERELTSLAGHDILIAGIDEVGRGPLAGPVVTACVALPLDRLIEGVDDSKKLSEKKREALYPALIKNASYVKTAWVWQDEIDRVNILNATRRAMEECAADFPGDLILVDAVDGITLPCPHKSLLHGDAISYMIAAASIVAKVERDRYMVQAAQKYPAYGFDKNKGYGTAAHIAALKECGACELHRQSFIQKFI